MRKPLGIIIIAFNDLEAIKIQIELHSKFSKIYYQGENFVDLIIHDNSNNPEIAAQISGLCSGSDLFVGDFRNVIYQRHFFYTNPLMEDWNNPSNSHALALQQAFDNNHKNYEYLLFLDHDCFPVLHYGLGDLLGGKHFGGIAQDKNKLYLWPGCLALNMNLIDPGKVDFSTNENLSLDTGGNLFNLLEQYGNNNCKFYDEIYQVVDPEFDPTQKYGYHLICGYNFMHFSKMSNWSNHPEEEHNERKTILYKQLRKLADL